MEHTNSVLPCPSNSGPGPFSNSALPQRPKFSPSASPFAVTTATGAGPATWVSVISCPAYYPAIAFEAALETMVLEPERSSGLILRGDIVRDSASGYVEDDPGKVEQYIDELDLRGFFRGVSRASSGLELSRTIDIKLLPNKPAVDSSLRQTCHFLRRRARSSHLDPEQEDLTASHADTLVEESLVLMTPLVASEEDIPHYHPPVKRIAFHWTPIATSEVHQPALSPKASTKPDALSGGKQDVPEPQPIGRLSISILPFQPLSPSSRDSKRAGAQDRDLLPLRRTPTIPRTLTSEHVLANRLYRTCLQLLETADKYAWGALVGYKKKVETDTIIDKAAFQDLYLTLKARHKDLDSRSAKRGSNQVVDVKRHVWKDVAIAAFLMLLWKDMYPARITIKEGTPGRSKGDPTDERQAIVLPNGKSVHLRSETRAWDAWGRPPNGFLDLGCGNGLLVHILLSEGYEGQGLELRARRTWPAYPQLTQDRLIEKAIDPSTWFPATMDEWRAGCWKGRSECPIEEGMYLIGNHADEMTPWIPLLSLIPAEPIPYLSLPCCLHTLTAMFTKTTFKIPAPSPGSSLSLPISDEELGHGIDAGKYGAYVRWLGWVGLRCGWMWEKEALRIPSTRGWGIVARHRWTENATQELKCREYVLSEVMSVRERGGFSLRKGEGAGHDRDA